MSKHNGKLIIGEYLSGRRAARAGQAAPSDATRHFLDGFRVEQRDAAAAGAGWDYKQGRCSVETLADVVKGQRSYP